MDHDVRNLKAEEQKGKKSNSTSYLRYGSLIPCQMLMTSCTESQKVCRIWLNSVAWPFLYFCQWPGNLGCENPLN